MLKSALLASVLLTVMPMACMALGCSLADSNALLFGANALRTVATDRFAGKFDVEFNGGYSGEVVPC